MTYTITCSIRTYIVTSPAARDIILNFLFRKGIPFTLESK